MRLTTVCRACDQLRPGDDRIDALMRHRRMAAVAAHGDLEGAGAGHDRPRHHHHLADRNARPVVQAEHRLDREALEQAILDHHRRPTFRFLGRLENEGDDAVEIRMPGQVARRAEQHRGVAVMAAGVHLSLMSRVVRKLVHLDQRQGIHVGAQADHALRGPGTQNADHPGSGDAAMHFEPVALQFACNDVGGAVLVEGQFRVRVNIAAQRRRTRRERAAQEAEWSRT